MGSSISCGDPIPFPSNEELARLFDLRFRGAAKAGWGVRRRIQLQYYDPEEYYGALVERIVKEDTRWLDVGGGATLFPSNRPLARHLSERCRHIVAVDPSPNVLKNPYVHERAQCLIEDYQADRAFDLATMRMVAEHVERPSQVIAALHRLLRPGGQVILYTVNRWSPVTVVSRLLPFKLHHPVKRLVWGSLERNTFPTFYRMNTRRCLRDLFEQGGFRERLFCHLDDCRTFARFKGLNAAEMLAWRLLKRVGLSYPENCLLGVYERL